jgi:transcriptional regulator with XRE-family HTH domain
MQIESGPTMIDAHHYSPATRGQIWSRLETIAFLHYKLEHKHGLNTRIAKDAARSSQTVGDWKSGRSPIPKRVIERLAEHYGVSVAYLLCLSDTPEPRLDLSQKVVRERMNEMVNNVLDRLNVELPGKAVIPLCETALSGLVEGQTEACIYGAIFMQVMALSPAPQAGSQ